MDSCKARRSRERELQSLEKGKRVYVFVHVSPAASTVTGAAVTVE